MVQVKIINSSSCEEPAYATSGASGMDIRADIRENWLLQPMERKLVPTGIYLEIPAGYEAQVRPRSGLAVRNGITCLNTPGTIDSDYRGEVKVLLINLSGEVQKIEPKERIAQLVFAKIEKVSLINAVSLNTSDRAEGGFGHTGKQ